MVFRRLERLQPPQCASKSKLSPCEARRSKELDEFRGRAPVFRTVDTLGSSWDICRFASSMPSDLRVSQWSSGMSRHLS